LLFELTRDIRIVLPLMAAAGLSAALVERWQGLHDPGLLGPDPIEERRRQQLAALGVGEAIEAEAPLVLPAHTLAADALQQLVAARGHCLLLTEAGWITGLVTLGDLQRGLTIGAAAKGSRSGSEHGSGGGSGSTAQIPIRLEDCRRGDLVWLPANAELAQLEDQLNPNDLRQIPIFAVSNGLAGRLPHGLPSAGLPMGALRGMASRDGMAQALARQAIAISAADQP
jgi:hypothetical protein